MELSRLALAVCISALLAACSQQDPATDPIAADGQPEFERHEADIDAGAAPEPEPEPATPAPDDTDASGPDEADAPGFDIESVPVSERPLGDFPYFSLPEGYHNPNRPVPDRDFDRVAVWTGDRLEWVEGRIHESLIRAEGDKAFSRLELDRNIEHQVNEAGGVKVTDSRPPREIRREWGDEQQRSPGRGDIYNRAVITYLVRREDREIWIHLLASNTGGSWMVIESAPFVPTSALLPSSELREQLDADGRVAVQVNFATDEADILPESQPQIEQILELLEQDPELQLAVNGHTDDTGGAEHNQRLSETRAQSVVAALTGAGIDAARLEAGGFGQSEPVADNDTEQGRAQNRRVELVRR